jgi:hypothetical protein
LGGKHHRVHPQRFLTVVLDGDLALPAGLTQGSWPRASCIRAVRARLRRRGSRVPPCHLARGEPWLNLGAEGPRCWRAAHVSGNVRA